MEKQQVIDITEALGCHRRLFWYYPGRFAHWLLANARSRGVLKKFRPHRLFTYHLNVGSGAN